MPGTRDELGKHDLLSNFMELHAELDFCQAPEAPQFPSERVCYNLYLIFWFSSSLYIFTYLYQQLSVAHEKLAQGHQRLAESSKRLDEARRISEETQEIGASILQELSQQRASIREASIQVILNFGGEKEIGRAHV